MTALFAGSAVVLCLGTAATGAAYYRLPHDLRATSYLDPFLRAGGPCGVWLGVIGTTLMLGMLLYTLRKKFISVRWMGPIGGWLRFHIICGIAGPTLIVLHSGVAWPKGMVAIAFWCMVLVALSGVFGRYVYSFFPKATGGRAVELAAAREALTDLHADLVAQTADVRSGAIGEAVDLVRGFQMKASSFGDLLRLNQELLRRSRAIEVLLFQAGLDEQVRASALVSLVEALRLKRNMEAFTVSQRMFRYWHLFHRPLAGAMYLLVGFHVASALLLGGSLQQLTRILH